MFSRIKQFLPGSSRSLHTMHEEITQMHKELAQMRKEFERLYDSIEIADHGINGNIDFKFEERVLPKMKQLSDNLQAHDSHMKMFAWEQFRNNGETLVDAKKTVFFYAPQSNGRLALTPNRVRKIAPRIRWDLRTVRHSLLVGLWHPTRGCTP